MEGNESHVKVKTKEHCIVLYQCPSWKVLMLVEIFSQTIYHNDNGENTRAPIVSKNHPV